MDTKHLVNFKVNRVRLITTKKIDYANVMAETKEEALKKIKDGEMAMRRDCETKASCEGYACDDILSIDETYSIEEVK